MRVLFCALVPVLLLALQVRAAQAEEEDCAILTNKTIVCNGAVNNVDVDVTLGSSFTLGAWSSHYCSVRLKVPADVRLEIYCNLEDHECADEQYLTMDTGRGPVFYCNNPARRPKTRLTGYSTKAWPANPMKIEAEEEDHVIKMGFYYPSDRRAKGKYGGAIYPTYCTIDAPDDMAAGELDEDCGVAPIGSSNRMLAADEDDDDEEVEDRIIGGNLRVPDFPTVRQEHNYPWMVFINTKTTAEDGRSVSGQSAATLINNQWLLTVGHTFSMNPAGSPVATRQAKICVGPGASISPRSGKRRCHADVVSTDVYVHEDFDFDTMLHDVALIKLPSPVTYTNYVRPVCLATSKPRLGTEIITTGWGRFSNANNKVAGRLMRGKTTVVDKIRCFVEESQTGMNCLAPRGNFNSKVFAPCNGDYGGYAGAVVNGKAVQYGIPSYGSRHNRIREVCDIYVANTDVATYLDWIKATIAANQ